MPVYAASSGSSVPFHSQVKSEGVKVREVNEPSACQTVTQETDHHLPPQTPNVFFKSFPHLFQPFEMYHAKPAGAQIYIFTCGSVFFLHYILVFT